MEHFFSLLNHPTSWCNLGFLITVLAVTAWLSDFLQQKCVAPLARVIPHSRPPVVHWTRRKQQASQWKTWANVLNRPTLLWLFSGAITFFRHYGGEIPTDGRQPLSSVVLCSMRMFMQAHAEFQVCLVLYQLIWSTKTCDSPLRFSKWVWSSVGKLLQGQRWVMELMADQWGVWCSAGIVCYCVIVTLKDVKVRIF